jgi:hypothetical protein
LKEERENGDEQGQKIFIASNISLKDEHDPADMGGRYKINFTKEVTRKKPQRQTIASNSDGSTKAVQITWQYLGKDARLNPYNIFKEEYHGSFYQHKRNVSQCSA